MKDLENTLKEYRLRHIEGYEWITTGYECLAKDLLADLIHNKIPGKEAIQKEFEQRLKVPVLVEQIGPNSWFFAVYKKI